MKPISLKIKGLNSFMEIQEIDFEKLTEKGLFGIFGPTGSGKSSILDGITLALYGKVSRNSTNFMNTNLDFMNVSYEFQMTDWETRRYRVDREFKRSKTGSITSKLAKIVDVTHGEEILEEGTNAVNEKCTEIIGLNLDDFTRTVVLPQGKFSEFLKLAGTERRNMLERLFNLEKYGDDLSNKLKVKISVENQKSSILEGELKSYEDVTNDILKEKSGLQQECKKSLEKVVQELEEAEKSYNEAKELWQHQCDLNDLVLKEKSLKEKEGQINEYKVRAQKGEGILKVKPFFDSYENTLNEITKTNNELNELVNQCDKIKEEKKNAEALLEQAKEKKDHELPRLQIHEQRVADAIEEKKAMDILLNDKEIIENILVKAEENLNVLNKTLIDKGNYIEKINAQISLYEGKIESLKVPEAYKNKVNEGFVLLSVCENLQKQKNSIKKDIDNISGIISTAQKKSDDLSIFLNNKKEMLSNAENELKNLNDNCPGNQDDLLVATERLKSAKDKWDKHKEYGEAINKGYESIKLIKETLNKLEHNKISLENETENLKQIIKKAETENLAHSLREALQDGDVCPVCGSTEHHRENIKGSGSFEELNELNSKLNLNEKELNKINGDIIKNQTKLSQEEINVESYSDKLKSLGEDYKTISVAALQNEFNMLYKSINEYAKSKEKLEKQNKLLSDEKNNLLVEYTQINNTLEHNKELLKKNSNDLSSKDKDLNAANEKLSLLKAELNIDDFKLVREQINSKETEKAKLEIETKKFREQLSKEQDEKEKLTGEETNLKIKLNEKKTTLIEKTKSISEKQQNILNKVGAAENLEKLKEDIINSIKNIELQYKNAENNKKRTEEMFENINNSINSKNGRLTSLKERSAKDEQELHKAMDNEEINSVHEIKNNYIPREKIAQMKKLVEDYNDSLSQLTGAMKSLVVKIKNRSLSQEEWLIIQNTKTEKTNARDNLKEVFINLETEVKGLIVRLEAKKELLKKKDELDYKLAILSDLEKLFRGKRFVEFVAANQLKYVSMEASKKLKEITGGTYGLEVDENGKFIIRDYKNGGAERDASTLSGGETFVASLALALALSTQIQLKGTSPLELFFLDEGFGTLDDNLLDVVMDSLEKIHNDKLSIGLISHVESIKNRVPVKLIVSPAVAGLGGSKVRIERN